MKPYISDLIIKMRNFRSEKNNFSGLFFLFINGVLTKVRTPFFGWVF